MNSLQESHKMIQTQLLELPVPYLPKKKFGKFEIKYVSHKKGESLPVIDMRMAFMTGLRPSNTVLKNNWTEMQLLIDGNKWMSTHPTENIWQVAPTRKAHGDVLVGGLGLGFALYEMMNNPKIKSITCIEIEKDLIKFCEKYFPKVLFICEDIFQVLKELKYKFDFIYLDTWTGTNECEFYDTVAPLRKLALPLIKKNSQKNLYCWAEEVMRGQFILAIQSRCLFYKMDDSKKEMIEKALKSDEMSKTNKVIYDFFNKYSIKEMSEKDSNQINSIAQEFVYNWEIK
jgi:hypothetical protein